MIISLTGFMGCGKSSVGRRLSELLCCPFVDLDSVIEERAGRTIPEIFAADGEAAFRRMEHQCLLDVVSIVDVDERLRKQSLPSHAMGHLAAKAHRAVCSPLALLCGQRGSTVSATAHPHLPINNYVLSLGGGTVMTPECAELIREKTTCIYLRASVDTLVANLSGEASDRPLLSTCHAERPKGDGTSADRLRTRIESLMSQRSSTYEAVATHIIDTDGLTIDTLALSILRTISL